MRQEELQKQSMMNMPWDREDEIDLGEYLGVLLDAKWMILVVAMLATLCAGTFAYLTTPIYQSDALVQVEDSKASIGGSKDLLDLMDQGGASADTEIEIMRSRSVIGRVVANLKLDVVAQPILFPGMGEFFYRKYHDEGFREPVFGLGSYAWGGEKIQIESLEVPEDMIGEHLSLIAQGNGKFSLSSEDVVLLEGETNQLAYNASGVSVYISQLDARPGTQFELVKRRMQDVISDALSQLSVTEKGKGTGIISLSFSSASPLLAKDIVDSVANVYLRQNVERKSEEAKRSINFLKKQLPEVRLQLETAETEMNEFRLKSGSVNLSLETQAILAKVVELDQKLSELDMQRTDLSQRFTDNHPLLQALGEKRSRLMDEKLSLEKKVKQLPETEQKMLTLMRNVKVNTELYTFLLNKTQELKVVEAGTVGNVRVLDYAVLPYQPVKPKKMLITVLGFVLGLFIGVLIAFIRKAMHQGVEDPDLVEKKLGLSAFAGIPHSLLQGKLHEEMRRSKGKSGNSLLASVDHTDLSIESLRSLRTNLHFALLEASNNVVMMTGPAPGLGKSFVSANFGAVLASSGQKVLLIDADMRKGHLHEYFGMDRNPGLSGLISGSVKLEDAIHSTDVKNLCVMPTGVLPPNPADLLMNEKFDDILARVSSMFDLVLIDTPPVLAVTDAVLIGRRAGVSFMLLRSGRHPMREIEAAIKQVEKAGISLAGFIFNDIFPKRSAYGYGGYGNYNYHYQYAYKKDNKNS
ncbi:MAG: hypothetical protein AUJ56_11975 [Zetaproteobacteria bacterium CG1_02_49_23]|nr:MAG: hypothetical protein AUJ56_11975 [Zetaproteobacteria bacterium CG1_02_49_23]